MQATINGSFSVHYNAVPSPELLLALCNAAPDKHLLQIYCPELSLTFTLCKPSEADYANYSAWRLERYARFYVSEINKRLAAEHMHSHRNRLKPYIIVTFPVPAVSDDGFFTPYYEQCYPAG